jgi:hypothetical protein
VAIQTSPGANFSPMLREVGLTRNHSSFLSDKSVRSTQFAPRKTKGSDKNVRPTLFLLLADDREPTTNDLSRTEPARA